MFPCEFLNTHREFYSNTHRGTNINTHSESLRSTYRDTWLHDDIDKLNGDLSWFSIDYNVLL